MVVGVEIAETLVGMLVEILDADVSGALIKPLSEILAEMLVEMLVEMVGVGVAETLVVSLIDVVWLKTV